MDNTNLIKQQANIIIDALGGTVKVSELFRITTGAVSQWRKSGIPDARMMYIKKVYPKIYKQSL